LFRTGFSGPIYAHAGCTQQRFRIKEGTPTKSIGIPLESLNRARDLITPFPPDGRLDQGLFAISPIPRRHDLFQATMDFFLDPEGTLPDTVEDDLALLLDSPKGPVLLLGCCHSGLANTMYAAGDTAGIKKFHAVVGGLHLTGAGPKAVEESAAVIEEFGVGEVYAGHCTGVEEMQELARMLPGRVKPLGAGRVLGF
jgi:7,8-dihydropterin-6-yl-methyl-4-(beta-D-ribofuranosyl)aminobenzene 5'-phosphate synthase